MDFAIIVLGTILSSRFDDFFFEYFGYSTFIKISFAVTVLLLNNFRNKYLIFAVFFGSFLAQIINNFNIPIAMGIALGFSSQAYLAIIIRQHLDITLKESLNLYYRPISYTITALISPFFYSVLNSLAFYYFKPRFTGAIESIFITNYLREILSYMIILPAIKYLISKNNAEKMIVILISILSGFLAFIFKFELVEALLFSSIFIIIIPNLIGYKGGGVIILLSVALACFMLNISSSGPYNLSSVNQSVFSYQLIFL